MYFIKYIKNINALKIFKDVQLTQSVYEIKH